MKSWFIIGIGGTVVVLGLPLNVVHMILCWVLWMLCIDFKAQQMKSIPIPPMHHSMSFSMQMPNRDWYHGVLILVHYGNLCSCTLMSVLCSTANVVSLDWSSNSINQQTLKVALLTMCFGACSWFAIKIKHLNFNYQKTKYINFCIIYIIQLHFTKFIF